MSPERDDLAYLWDMLKAARAVVSFVQGRTLEDYLGDLLLRSAVERINWVRIPKHSGSLWSTPSFVLFKQAESLRA